MAKDGKDSKRDALVRENQQLRDELKHCRRSKLASNWAPIVRTAVQYGMPSAAVAYCIHEIAGRETFFTALVDASVVADVGEGKKEPDVFAVAAIFTLKTAIVLALILAVWQNLRYRNLNKSLVSDLGKFRERYERTIHPDRTSSQLGSDGQTRKEDEV
jgi:hypothetical protein